MIWLKIKKTLSRSSVAVPGDGFMNFMFKKSLETMAIYYIRCIDIILCKVIA